MTATDGQASKQHAEPRQVLDPAAAALESVTLLRRCRPRVRMRRTVPAVDRSFCCGVRPEPGREHRQVAVARRRKPCQSHDRQPSPDGSAGVHEVRLAQGQDLRSHPRQRQCAGRDGGPHDVPPTLCPDEHERPSRVVAGRLVPGITDSDVGELPCVVGADHAAPLPVLLQDGAPGLLVRQGAFAAIGGVHGEASGPTLTSIPDGRHRRPAKSRAPRSPRGCRAWRASRRRTRRS